MDKIIYFGLVFSLLTLAFMLWELENIYGEPDTFVWVGLSGEYRQVPIYYVDVVNQCNEKLAEKERARGCYLGGIDEAIYLDKDELFDWSPQGCNVWSHEVYHAWGYKHNYGALSYTCPNPSWEASTDYLLKSYDPSFVKHWEPTHTYQDSDADGIRDNKDNCPTQRETYNRYMDHDGCPDIKPPGGLYGR